jgi:preprotein translocase subunit SecE
MARTPRRRAEATPVAAGASPEAAARRARENLPRPSAGPSLPARTATPGGGAPAPARGRKPFGFLGRISPRFVSDIISELRKVTWPTVAETRYLTIVVAIVAGAVGILLGSLDLVFGWVIEQLFF